MHTYVGADFVPIAVYETKLKKVTFQNNSAMFKRSYVGIFSCSHLSRACLNDFNSHCEE